MLRKNYAPGEFQSARDVNRTHHLLSSMRGRDGITVDIDPVGGIVIKGGGVGSWSGLVFTRDGREHFDADRTTSLSGAGSEISHEETEAALYIVVSKKIASGVPAYSVSTTDAAMPHPMPANEQWYRISQCPGDIHCFL